MRGADFAADWLPTVIEGIFGLELDHGDESSGAPVRALDGKNLCECDDGPRKCSPCTHGAPPGRRGEDECCLLTDMHGLLVLCRACNLLWRRLSTIRSDFAGVQRLLEHLHRRERRRGYSSW